MNVQDRLALILGQYIHRTVIQQTEIEELIEHRDHLLKRVHELEDKYEPETTSTHSTETT